MPQREQVEAWEASLAVSGLPLARLAGVTTRPRLTFAAPLGSGIAAERELLDLFLGDRRPIAEVRVRLAGSLPAGHDLVDLYDVWLGEPPLSGQVMAAEYRIEVSTRHRDEAAAGARDLAGGAPDSADDVPDAGALAAACAELLQAEALPRVREKGGRTATYDLRPLVVDVRVLSEPGGVSGAAVLVIQTRFDPNRGVGRPEEVLLALSELAGLELPPRSIVRARLLLAGDVPWG